MQDVLNSIPKQEYVDLVSMYKAIGGLDGTTTDQALADCRDSFIGKYYVLQGMFSKSKPTGIIRGKASMNSPCSAMLTSSRMTIFQ
jgi:hypothetical protein